MWTPVVVEAERRTERGGAAGRAAVGHPVGPFGQQRLNEPLGFAIGLRPVGASKAPPYRPSTAVTAEDARPIGHGVVGEQPPNALAAPPKPRQGALQARGASRRILGRAHLGIGEPRRVVNRDMSILPARPPPGRGGNDRRECHGQC